MGPICLNIVWAKNKIFFEIQYIFGSYFLESKTLHFLKSYAWLPGKLESWIFHLHIRIWTFIFYLFKMWKFQRKLHLFSPHLSFFLENLLPDWLSHMKKKSCLTRLKDEEVRHTFFYKSIPRDIFNHFL